MWKVDSAVFLSVIMWIWRFPFHSFYCRSLKHSMGYNQLQNASMCNAHGKAISICISALTASLRSEAAGTWISAPEEILTFHMLFSSPVRKQWISSPQPSDTVKPILDQPEHGLDKKNNILLSHFGFICILAVSKRFQQRPRCSDTCSLFQCFTTNFSKSGHSARRFHFLTEWQSLMENIPSK